MEKIDYYKVLEINKSADAAEIKKAYKMLAIKYHPDRNPDDINASKKMAALNEAYAVLSNSDKRKEYDMLHSRFGDDAAGRFRQSNSYEDILRNSDLEKIFQEIAESFGIRGLNDLFSNVHINSTNSDFNSKGIHGGGFFFFTNFGHNADNQDYIKSSGSETSKLKPHQKIIREIGGKVAKKVVDKLVKESMKALNNNIISNDKSNIDNEMNNKNSGGGKSKYNLKDMYNSKTNNDNKDIYDIITLSFSHAKDGGPYAYYNKNKEKKFIVKIPKNIQDGHKIRLKGAGNKNSETGEQGDIFLVVNISSEKIDAKHNIENFFSKIKNFISLNKK